MKKSELTEFVWSKECQEGFDALKHALTTAPVLAYPDYSQPFILETDASLKGLGAVLSQKGKDGEVHIIAYASRSLRPSERSMHDYSSAKIELMALKWSVCEKFKDYLLGSKFTVFTDNNPLVYVKKITTWRSRSSQIAGSSTQQLLLCNNATFDDIILQHLMTSFWMTCTFWILNKQVKNSFLKLCTIFHRSSLDLDLDLDVV